MSIEKTGVCDGENEEPVASGITRQTMKEATELPRKQAEARSCGQDLMSRLSDTVTKTEKDS